MKITIDCRHIDSSGIGVYLKECLPFFFDTENYFFLLGDAEKLKFTARRENTEIVHCTIKPFSIRDVFVFPLALVRKINSSNLFYSPYFNIPSGVKVPIYSTIHDIVFPDMPELTSKTGRVIRLWFYRRAFKKSCTVFTVSEFSKKRIEFHLGTSKPVIVTHSAIQPMFLGYKAKTSNAKKNNTIIFVGNMKKNKGLDCLLDAFLMAKSEGLPHKLIIIGGRENFRTTDKAILKKINSFNNESISFNDHVSNEQLMDYISEASLLIHPSRYEGFGLPPLEAMVLGTHVLISDIPVFKEIYEAFPVTFFRVGDSNDLKEKMMKLLLNKADTHISLPKHLSTKYTFEKTAAAILEKLTFI